MKKPTELQVNKGLAMIATCEKRALVYNKLYELLCGFDSDINPEDESLLNLEIIRGDIISISALGKRFDELADYEYKKANNLLKEIKGSL